MFLRRREILEIIRDHPYCSFDFAWRHFPQASHSTIHYHLLILSSQGFIHKIGSTRGVTYLAVS